MSKQSNLKTKLLLYILPALAVGLVATLLIINSVNGRLYRETAENNLKNLVDLAHGTIESITVSAIENSLQSISTTNLSAVGKIYENYQNGLISEERAKEMAATLLLRQTIGSTGYNYVVDTNGLIQVHPSLSAGTDLSNYDFIQTQMAQKNGYIEYLWHRAGGSADDPDDQKVQKSLCMSYFEPWDWIISSSSYRSEFVELIDTNRLNDRLNKIRIGETGYLYVLDLEGNLVIHPAKKGENIANATDANGRLFIAEMLKNKSGVITYPWTNSDSETPKDKLVHYKFAPQLNWIIAAGEDIEDLYSAQRKVSSTMLWIFSVALLAIAGLLYFFVDKSTKPFGKVIQASDKLANADFRFTDLSIRSNDEFSKLGYVINSIKNNLKQLIQGISNDTNSVKTSSKEIEEYSNDSLNFVKTLSENINQISEGAQTSANSASNIATSASESSRSTKEMSDLILRLSEDSSEMVNKTQEGGQKIHELSDKIEASNAKVNMIKDSIGSLTESAEKISSISDVISSIAEQTNLLALNAAIESARAGEAGKGFAVVADEIRKLAEQTDNKAAEISSLIQTASENIQNSSKITNEVIEVFAEQLVAGNEVETQFTDISGSVDRLADNLTIIENSINAVVSQSENITQEISNVAAISQENSASTEEFLALTNELKEKISSVKDKSSHLFSVVDQLETSTSKFKI
jgi:methyl-accepting chemotaxis protein